MSRAATVMGIILMSVWCLVGFEVSAVAQEKEAAEALESEAASEAEKGPTMSEKKKAEQKFKEGAKAYNTEKYEVARKLFLEAYETFPAAVFLYNAALANRQLGNDKQALKFARRARAEQRYPLPDKLAKKNNRMIHVLATRSAQREYEEELAEARKLDWRGWTGVGTATAGGIAMVVGLGVFGQKALEGNRELTEIREQNEYEVKRDEVEANRNTAQVLLFSGAGLMLAGGGLVVWDILDVPERPASVRVGPARDGMQVQIEWRF